MRAKVILESLSENIQRGNLSYLEVAEGLRAYKEEYEKEAIATDACR